MKTTENYPELSGEEKLKAENELLKMKLTAEFGMKQSDMPSINDEIENQWLNQIYEYEKSYANSKTIKVCDSLGSPEFKPSDGLNDIEISEALKSLTQIMEERNLMLDIICDYEDRVIYKFITEELFNEETDDIRMEGMTRHFCYEEFHPNHEYDLKRQTTDFFNNLLEREWNDEFDNFQLDESIFFKDKNYDRDSFTNIIYVFQENKLFKMINAVIEKVKFSLDESKGEVKGSIEYNNNLENFSGDFELGFKFDGQFWNICMVNIPGFGK